MTNEKAPERIGNVSEVDRVAARRLIHTLGSITGFENRVDLVLAALATVRAEEREAAFAAIGVELRRYGANIRKVDLLARFQELFRELEATENRKGEG